MLLASDYDNTLYFPLKGFNEEDLKAINAFQQEGHLFGICTGRSLTGVKAPSAHADIHYDFYICLSGALIANEAGDVIFEKKIPYDSVKEVLAAYHVFATVVADDCMYGRYFGIIDHLRHLIRRLRHMRPLKSLKQLKSDSVNGFSLHFLPAQIEQAKECAQLINEDYGHIMTAFQNKNHVDVVAQGCSKGAGIRFLKDYYQLSDEELCGIGDSWNDLPMLNEVNHAFTFNQSPDDVKAVCQYYVDSIAECIDQLMK